MTLEALPGATVGPSTDELDRVEIDAWRDYCAAAPPAFAQAVGLKTAEFDGPLLAMCERIDHYQFNRLMGGGLAGDADGRSLAIAVERFRDAGLKNGYLKIAPGQREWALDGAAMFVADGRAWLGIGAVQAGARRRGGQGALLARRIADGLVAGARRFATETGKPLAGEPHPSFSNIQRAGFSIAYERANWTL